MKYLAIVMTGVAVLCGGPAREALAQLASRPAEEWRKTLDQPDRIAGLKTDQVIARLGLKPGQVVADLGAGTGVFSVPLAKAVAPGGKVYAVEVDKGYFADITDKAKDARVTNVQTVLGEFGDPKLPAADVDVAFFHDVLHHIDDRAGYLKNVARYVKPSGRIVVIDLKPEQSPHKDQPNLVVSEEQVTAWMAAAGFHKVEKTDLFAEKYFLVYAR
ncbi:MAG TPA: methyltransferase domain-containing protein [Vicinamibacterales bacterium]|jgi:ubiquinone/menaquinone biosynthesis C-methylase UbiE